MSETTEYRYNRLTWPEMNEAIRAQHSIAGMVDTPAGLEVRLLAKAERAPADSGWESVSPTLEDAYLWLIHSGQDHD